MDIMQALEQEVVDLSHQLSQVDVQMTELATTRSRNDEITMLLRIGKLEIQAGNLITQLQATQRMLNLLRTMPPIPHKLGS